MLIHWNQFLNVFSQNHNHLTSRNLYCVLFSKVQKYFILIKPYIYSWKLMSADFLFSLSNILKKLFTGIDVTSMSIKLNQGWNLQVYFFYLPAMRLSLMAMSVGVASSTSQCPHQQFRGLAARDGDTSCGVLHRLQWCQHTRTHLACNSDSLLFYEATCNIFILII